MAIPDYAKTNFETLLRAAADRNLALLECYDRSTRQPVYTLCAVNRPEGGYEFAPLARLFDANPYDELDPPAPGDAHA